MKCATVLCCIAVVGFGLSVPQVSADKPSWQLQVELVDGSRIVGSPHTQTLRLNIGFDELAIPLQRIRRADWNRAGKNSARIELANNDVLTGTIISEPVKLSTLFGDVTLDMQHFKSLVVQPKNPYGWLPTNKGLIAYYSFDKPVKSRVLNDASEKHAGAVEGATWTELGKRGGGIQLNGSSKVTIPHDDRLCPKTLTVSAWVYPAGRRGQYAFLLGKSNGSSWSGGYGFVYKSGDSKNVHFYVNGYTTSVVKTELLDNRWTHIAGICDGKTVKIYRDGELADKASLPAQSQNTDPIRHTKTPLVLGSDTSGYYWPGKLDEVAIYDRPLSGREVQRLYEVGAVHTSINDITKPGSGALSTSRK